MNILNILFLIKAYQLCSNIFLEYFTVIENIDYNKYNGNWYEIYVSEFSNLNNNKIEKCIKHKYEYINDCYEDYCEKLLVTKKFINENDEYKEVDAFMINKSDKKGNGKLSFYINNNYLSIPYWIIKLGEIKDNQYQYSIISNPLRSSLIVLGRDIYDFNDKYNKEVLEYLSKYNFNYIKINHTYCEI
jgi:lipocalin